MRPKRTDDGPFKTWNDCTLEVYAGRLQAIVVDRSAAVGAIVEAADVEDGLGAAVALPILKVAADIADERVLDGDRALIVHRFARHDIGLALRKWRAIPY
jgi:ABC-type amino acid transport substrate-binding protein